MGHAIDTPVAAPTAPLSLFLPCLLHDHLLFFLIPKSLLIISRLQLRKLLLPLRSPPPLPSVNLYDHIENYA